MLIVTDKFLQYGSSRSNNHGVPGISLKDVFQRSPKVLEGQTLPRPGPLP